MEVREPGLIAASSDRALTAGPDDDRLIEAVKRRDAADVMELANGCCLEFTSAAARLRRRPHSLRIRERLSRFERTIRGPISRRSVDRDVATGLRSAVGCTVKEGT
jgi:hypothetical protein